MKFKELSTYLEKLEKTSSRLVITDILADLFKSASAEEIDKIVYLILGILAPSYEGVVFNLAERMVIRIIAKTYQKTPEEVLAKYKKSGDLGAVAEELAKGSRSSAKGDVEVELVYKSLRLVAADTGESSQERKIDAFLDILSQLDPLSARYAVRIPTGNLRLGFSDKTIIDALSLFAVGDKSARAEIEEAYQVMPDVGKIAQLVKKKGVKNLKDNITPIIGVPVLPMLAQRLKSPAEMIKKMGEVAVEPKFDGLRVLIHFKKGEKTRAFTRNLNNISDMFPELNKIENYLGASEVILDSEAVGLDPKTKKMVDFQTTMQRRRKHDIEKIAENIPINFQVFDIIFKDGKSFMDMPYEDRRAQLSKTIKKNPLLFVDEYIVTSDPEVIKKEHQKMLKYGLEGVIVKKLDSHYVPGRTGWRWVKMKEAEEAEGKLADTVDCLLMGYTQGKGKRAGFGIGQFLAGVRDGDIYKTITKVGTGLSDEQFQELARRLKKIHSRQMPKEYEVHKDLTPDFWVTPSVIVELAADEITKSPKHTAGLALRFPRLIKFRDDKSPKEATTLKELKDLFDLQKK